MPQSIQIKRKPQGGVWATFKGQRVWVDYINSAKGVAYIKEVGGISPTRKVSLADLDFGIYIPLT